MRLGMLLTAVLAVLLLGTAARAGDDGRGDKDAASPVDKIIEQYADSGVDGVVDVITNKQNEIEKVVIVGAARLSTVLGAADGLLEARREARLAAAGKFRQWLKEKVTIYEKSESERILVLEGKTGEGDESLKESGKKISKNTTKYESYAEGAVRGLQVLGYKTISPNKKEKIYVVVMGFDATTLDATKKLANDLDSDTPKNGRGGQQGDAGSDKDDTKEKRKLDDQQGVSPGAKKFFEKKP
jgi:hypothetical protein